MAAARPGSHIRNQRSSSRKFSRLWRWLAAKSGKRKPSAALIERAPDSQLMLQLFQHEPQASMTEELLRRGGVVRIRVLGQSMLPCIWPGDVVIIDGAARGHITIGDIALFRRQNRFFIHRVRKIVDDGICRQLITQGDSVDHEDPPFHSEEVLGKVIQVRRGGRRWIPTRRRSVLGLEWMLARSRRLRNLALRIREKATSTNSRGMI